MALLPYSKQGISIRGRSQNGGIFHATHMPALAVVAIFGAIGLTFNLFKREETTLHAFSVHRRHNAATARSAYQDLIFEQTASWRPQNVSGVAPGQSMCPRFFFHFRQSQSDRLKFGERLLVPLCPWWTLYDSDGINVDAARGYLHTLDAQYKYFMVEGMDKGLKMMDFTVPDGLDLLIFSGGGTNRGARNIPIPLLSDKMLEPTGLEKNITLSSTSLHTGSNPVRRKLILEIRSWANSTEMEPLQFVECDRLEQPEFEQLIEISNMTLAPRGHGTSSFRMYQALQMNTVPVYIWDEDKTLPFEELINWNEIAIVLSSSQLHSLRKVIDNFDMVRAQRLLPQYRHMWHYDFLYRYIMERLQNEPVMLPIPLASYDDQDTVWDNEPWS